MASNLEEIWRRKSDDELWAAAHRLEEYSEDGQRAIRAELERRQTPEYAASVEEAARKVVQAEQAFEASTAGLISRRLSLALVIVTIPLVGVVIAAGFQATLGSRVPEISIVLLLNRVAIAAAIAGMCLIVVIAV